MKKRRNNRLIALFLTYCIILSFSACDGDLSKTNPPDNSSGENNTDSNGENNKEDSGTDNNGENNKEENQQTQDVGFIPFDCYCELSEFRETISALSGDEFDALLAKENMPFDVAQRYVDMTKEMKVPAISGTNQRVTFSWNKNYPEYMIGTSVYTDKIDYFISTYQKKEHIIAEANDFISKLENIDDPDKVKTLDFCGYKVMFKITEDADNYYDKATTMGGYLILEDYVINIFSVFTVRKSSPDSAPSSESFLAEVDFDMFNFYTLDEMIEFQFTGEPGSFFEHDWHEYE
jgi:hypothetical protein